MRTILIVDDEESIRWSFMVMLQKAGYRVFTAMDYASALDLLQQVDVDVLVCDILLPGRSGLDILNWLTEKQRPLPVVLITGQPDVQSVERSCRLGAFEYLAKPVSRDTLLEVILRAVEQRDNIKDLPLQEYSSASEQDEDSLPPQATALQVAKTLFQRQLRERLGKGRKIEYVLRHLAMLYDNSPLAVVFTEGDRVPYLNASFTNLTGYTSGDLDSVHTAFELFYPDLETRQQALSAREQAHIQAKREEIDPVFLQMPIRLKNGETKPLAMCGVFLPDNSALYSFIEV